MISRGDLLAYATANRGIADRAVSELSRYLNAASFSNQPAIVQFIEAVLNRYGYATGVNASRFFTSQTGKQAVDVGKLLPKIGLLALENRPKLKTAVAVAAGVAAAGATATAVKVLADRVSVNQKLVAAEVMRESSRNNGMRYARVPTGGYTCEWCTMLASRGFVYRSEDTAGGDRFHGGELDRFHSFCDCEIVASDDDTVEGYDPSVYEDEYLEARRIILPDEMAGYERWESLSDGEREYFGSYSEFITKSIVAQMRALRSGNWDGNPVIPKIEHASNIASH